MKRYVGWWWLDFRRAFCSKPFFITILLLPIIERMSVEIEKKWIFDVVSALQNSTLAGFSLAIYALYTIPYAHTYCADISNRFIKYHVVRSSMKRYAISKVFFCALSSGVAVFIGEILTTVLLLVQFPLASEITILGGDDIISKTMGEEKTVLLVLTILVLASLRAAFFSVIAFTASTFFPNPFVVAAMPMILHYILANIVSVFPDVYRHISILRVYYLTTQKTLSGAVIYAFVFTVIAVTLMGYLSYRMIRRRFENE